MNIVEILTNNEALFLETTGKNKKVDSLVAETNALLANLYQAAQETTQFLESQMAGERNNLIVAAKSLQNFYEGNKILKVETLVAGLQKEEQVKVAQFKALRDKVLSNLALIQKTTKTDAITSNYDLFDGDLTRCQEGHEVIILGEHGQAILENIIEQVANTFELEGNFDSVSAGEFQYSMDVVNQNAAMCQNQANEIFASKPDKANKYMAIVEKMVEAAGHVVAFYTAREILTRLGANPKALKTYEAALSKAYIPYKKQLEKDLKVELNDICAVEVNEEMFPASEEMPTEPIDTLEEFAQTEIPEDEMTEVSPEDFAVAATQVGEEANDEVVEEAAEEVVEEAVEEPVPAKDTDADLKDMGSKLSSLTSNLKKMKKDK
ncbi:MAG: hypothetical protein E7354_04915 [Clostridiales bacterium]|nr:hypothetical protein [Clostridiales bacterium]